MENDTSAKRHCSDSNVGSNMERRRAALVKANAGLTDCVTHEIEIRGWRSVADGGERYYSNLADAPTVNFGNGRMFNVRLARYGASELQAAEEKGDFDMAPLELHLVAKRSSDAEGPALDPQLWPPHFKLLGYHCILESSRVGCDSFLELLDASNELHLRDADHVEGDSPGDTVAFAFALPGRLASCEDVGLSHDLLHKRVDALRESDEVLHLAIVVPHPEKQLCGSFDGSPHISLAQDPSGSEDDEESE